MPFTVLCQSRSTVPYHYKQLTCGLATHQMEPPDSLNGFFLQQTSQIIFIMQLQREKKVKKVILFIHSPLSTFILCFNPRRGWICRLSSQQRIHTYRHKTRNEGMGEKEHKVLLKCQRIPTTLNIRRYICGSENKQTNKLLLWIVFTLTATVEY